MALGGALASCARTSNRSRVAGEREPTEGALLQIFEIIERRTEGAFVWSRNHVRHMVSRDTKEQRFDVEESEAVVFGGRGRSVALWNASREELIAAAQLFVRQGNKAASGAASSRVLAPPDKFLPRAQSSVAREPAHFEPPVADLFARAQLHGDSRIIYRNAYLLADDVSTHLLGAAVHQERRELRVRQGVLFAAWTGDDISTSVAEQAAGGLALAGPSDSDLRLHAQAALASVHARYAPSGTQDVILSPECASLVALEAVAKPVFELGQRQVPKGPLRASNQPTLADAYGSYGRDDLGQVPKAQQLFGDQDAQYMARGAMRRDGELRLRALPANLIVTPGSTGEAPLVADVMEGVYLEGPQHCSVNSQGSHMSLLCSRGREIRNGRFTGRLFARLLASADCAAFLDQVRALGNVSRVQAYEESGQAISVQSPAWLSRARMGAAS